MIDIVGNDALSVMVQERFLPVSIHHMAMIFRSL